MDFQTDITVPSSCFSRTESKVEGIAVLTICNLSEGRRIISCRDYRVGTRIITVALRSKERPLQWPFSP
ncbi:hypothetical protein Q8A67_009784 [Cirrhinus molitorella]|uniref:Uncharacterized protein n=1 Tax=Cirrhinus molitorella TaxID=172907 RepID=A0AA88TPV3_9TELE|nr:hypothetical protein Q8A67_009784 [Cirrhinus molitorella]